jgi:transposase
LGSCRFRPRFTNKRGAKKAWICYINIMLTTAVATSPEPTPRERRLLIENGKLRARNAMLEAENETLLKRISELIASLAVETDKDRQLALRLELKLLKDRVNQQNRELFGTRSEKRGRPGPSKRGATKPKIKRSGSERTKQPALATASQLYLLDEADRVCPKCGGKLHAKAGKLECSERVVVSERVYTVVTDEKQVYGCGGCGASDTALGPLRLVTGGRYDSSIAVQAAVDKYTDHQPLNRQVAAMNRVGLKMSRQSLWDQLNALATLCEPSYQALHRWLLADQDLLHADETTWRMMLKGGSAQWWLWALASKDGFFCMVSPSRATKAARLLLQDFSGTLMTDAYSVYAKLANEADQDRLDLDGDRPWHPRFRHAVCWSHARRPFEKASKDDDDAHIILDLIAELYEIEARAKAKANGDESQLRNHRAVLRAAESKAVIDKIDSWRARQFALPDSKMHDGLKYLKNQWPKLIRFIDDPVIPLDNNLAERQVRAPVLGRRNHLGSHSERGAHVSALFYSLMGSCRLARVSPAHYLKALVERTLANKDYTLLPHQFAAETIAQ